MSSNRPSPGFDEPLSTMEISGPHAEEISVFMFEDVDDRSCRVYGSVEAKLRFDSGSVGDCIDPCR